MSCMKPNKQRNVFCLLSSARGNRFGPEFSLAHLPTIPCSQLVALSSDCAVRTIVIVFSLVFLYFSTLFVFTCILQYLSVGPGISTWWFSLTLDHPRKRNFSKLSFAFEEIAITRVQFQFSKSLLGNNKNLLQAVQSRSYGWNPGLVFSIMKGLRAGFGDFFQMEISLYLSDNVFPINSRQVCLFYVALLVFVNIPEYNQNQTSNMYVKPSAETNTESQTARKFSKDWSTHSYTMICCFSCGQPGTSAIPEKTTLDNVE